MPAVSMPDGRAAAGGDAGAGEPDAEDGDGEDEHAAGRVARAASRIDRARDLTIGLRSEKMRTTSGHGRGRITSTPYVSYASGATRDVAIGRGGETKAPFPGRTSSVTWPASPCPDAARHREHQHRHDGADRHPHDREPK